MALNNSNLLAGTAYLSVNGRQYMIAGKAAYQVSVTEREPMMSMRGFEGFSEKPMPVKIAMTVRDSKDLDVAAFGGLTNVGVVLELANGKRVSGGGMFVANTPVIDTESGTFDVEFVGRHVEEDGG